MNRDIFKLRTEVAAELDGATITDKQIHCYLPRPRPLYLVAYDIVDKLADLEGEIVADVLFQLIAQFPEVQQYLVDNHIDILIEEE